MARTRSTAASTRCAATSIWRCRAAPACAQQRARRRGGPTTSSRARCCASVPPRACRPTRCTRTPCRCSSARARQRFVGARAGRRCAGACRCTARARRAGAERRAALAQAGCDARRVARVKRSRPARRAATRDCGCWRSSASSTTATHSAALDVAECVGDRAGRRSAGGRGGERARAHVECATGAAQQRQALPTCCVPRFAASRTVRAVAACSASTMRPSAKPAGAVVCAQTALAAAQALEMRERTGMRLRLTHFAECTRVRAGGRDGQRSDATRAALGCCTSVARRRSAARWRRCQRDFWRAAVVSAARLRRSIWRAICSRLC
jgi:hypothetical protein